LTDIKSRKLSFTELFRAAGGMYKKYFPFLMLITAAFYLPLIAVTAFIPYPPTALADYLTALQAGDTASAAGSLATLAKYDAGCLAVSVVFQPFATAGVTYLALCAVENKPADMPGLLAASLERWWKLLFTNILFYALLLVSSPLIVLPLYFGVTFYFAVRVAAVTDKRGFSALKESAVIVRGRFLRTLVFIAVVMILNFCVNLFITGIIPIAQDAVVAAVVVSVVAKAVCVFFDAVLALWFWNMSYTRG